MTNPALVVITVGGSNLQGWTNMKLTRERKELTGALTFEMFFTNIPANPQMREVTAGAEIQVYIAGNLAFTGTIDSRTGSGKGRQRGNHHRAASVNDRNMGGVDRRGRTPSGEGVHSYADAESYKITVECRGKTKRLIDSSQEHPTGQMSNTTVPQIFQNLIQNFNVQLNNTTSDSIQIERAVFRDGATVFTELHRWAREHNHLVFEAIDGQLMLADDSSGGNGEPLILGTNILSFDATQSDGQGNSSVTIKGQRSGIKYHGNEAVMNKVKTTNPTVTDHSPVIYQLNGDASPDRLKRRSKYENDRATQECKQITIDVFSVQTSTGTPWDLNITHYVEIPPEGIYNEFVVDSLTYFCEAHGSLKTELQLVPVAQQGDGSSVSAISDGAAYGQARAAAAGLVYNQGSYPSPWVIPAVESVLTMGGAPPPSDTSSSNGISLPPNIPTKLPPGYV